MSGYFKFAAIAAALVIIALALAIIPLRSWDAATFVGTLLLASAAAIPFAAPRFITGWGNSETGTLAAVGPSGVISSGYFLLALITFVLALVGADRIYIWILAIMSMGWLIIGSSVTKGSLQFLDRTFPNKPANTANRATIIAALSGLKSVCPGQFTNDIDRLSETLRYAASDLPNSVSPETESVLSLVKDELTLSCRTNNPDDFRRAVIAIEEMIAKRDEGLKAARSKL
jgi:hypothetical protein